MRGRGFRRASRLCSAAGALALLCLSAPLQADAAVDWTGAASSSLCQVNLTVQMTSYAVSMVVPGSVTAEPTYTMAGTGTCTGLLSGSFQLSSGSGVTVTPPTCADFLSDDGGANAFVGSTPFTFAFTLASATAAGQMAMTSFVTAGGAGAAQLPLTQASLQACEQPGGT